MNENSDIITRLQKTTHILLQKEIKEINDMLTKREKENFEKLHYYKLLDKINLLEKKDKNDISEKSTSGVPTALFGKSSAQKTFDLPSNDEKPLAFGTSTSVYSRFGGIPRKEEKRPTFGEPSGIFFNISF